jgi:hypothetical protein
VDIVVALPVALASALTGFAFARVMTERKFDAIVRQRVAASIADSDSPGSEQPRVLQDAPQIQALLALEYQRGQEAGKNAALAQFKSSDELAMMLTIEYAKGKEAGAKSELEKFEISYQTVEIEHDNLWRNTKVVGYDMQLHYAGLPIGEPARRITQRAQKSKDDQVYEALHRTLGVIEAAATKAGIPIKVTKTIKREKAKK